jgi:hypothetical protein
MEGSVAVARARMIRRVQLVRQGVAIEFEHGYVNAAIGRRRFIDAIRHEIPWMNPRPHEQLKLVPIVANEDDTIQD